MRYIVVLFVVVNSVISFSNLFAQNLPDLGRRYVWNVTEESKISYPKIWHIEQDDKGILYFATPNGLVEYDGSRWREYSRSENSNTLCVLNSSDNVLYGSGYGVFGYYTRNEYGNLEFNKIIDQLDENFMSPYWKIVELDKHILVQSFKSILVYNSDNQQTNEIKADNLFSFIMKSKGEVFVGDQGKGLYRVSLDGKSLLKGTEKLESTVIGVINRGEEGYIIISSEDGVFLLKDEKLSALNKGLNNLLNTNSIYSYLELPDGNFYIGTVQDGAYLINSKGEVLYHLDKKRGLVYDTVLSLFQDKNEDLWLGLDGGVSYVETNSSIKYIDDDTEDFGIVYCSAMEDSLMYFGTNQGLFVKNINYPEKKSQLINGSQGQVWSLDKVGNLLLMGHNKGAFQVNGRVMTKVDGSDGGHWTFKQHPVKRDMVVGGTYLGINCYSIVDSKLVFEKSIEDFKESSRLIEFDIYGNLWMAHPSKGYFRFDIDYDNFKLNKVDTYKDHEPYYYLTKLDGNVLFYNKSGFYRFNPISARLEEDSYCTNLFSDIKNISYITQFANEIWYSSVDNYGLIQRNGNNTYVYRDYFSRLQGVSLGDFSNVNKLNNDVFAISSKKGLALFDMNKVVENQQIKVPELMGVNFIGVDDTISYSLKSSDYIDVPYSSNFGEFYFASPGVKSGRSMPFKYYLSGGSETWKYIDKGNKVSIPSIPPGNYKLYIGFGDNPKIEDAVEVYRFSISAPFFLQPFWIFIYILVFVFAVVMVHLRNKRNALKKEEEVKMIEQEKLRKEQRKFQLQTLESEKKLLELNEEKYQVELEKKNNELTASTMNNLRKNELLTELKQDIVKLSSQVKQDELKTKFNKFIKKIDSNISTKDDWLAFELNFNNAHGNFFARLREQYPELSPNDLKICAYLKLNLSSKEMSHLLNISTRSVEMSRYRLRKKLGLSKDDNLNQFIGLF